MRSFRITALLFAAVMLSFNTGCTQESPESKVDEPTAVAATETTAESKELDLSKLSTFELSSEDLHDGVWDTVITKTANGENRSPQLSWKPVDGASCYAVFMIDTSAGNWLHWKSVTDSETVLPAGWAPQSEYVGPYPPSGTHDYEIYVLALKEKPERIKGAFDNSNPKMLEYAKEIDGENEDNIISYGHLMGTYTHGE
ncbi:MAG: phosphatidylethanolamine-binding protein [Ruminococcus sp.]|uniref:YbhB/YbcL family Raf kinase inhibitor-like protein n=1 Tax=Ruminococcus sp. TaxID=41978 RepID=UPI0025E92428|nr:phosphatidylethanolamine-binding protein [Ruminococcus sp.]MCR4795558.1 phosphatidylethanolamine-binding protein [Ruminococcus sp.]